MLRLLGLRWGRTGGVGGAGQKRSERYGNGADVCGSLGWL